MTTLISIIICALILPNSFNADLDPIDLQKTTNSESTVLADDRISQKIVQQLQKDNIGIVVQGYGAKRVNDHVIVTKLDVSLNQWLQELTASHQTIPFFKEASVALTDQINAILKAHLRKTAYLTGIPVLNDGQPDHHLMNRRKRAPPLALMAGAGVITGLAALSVASSAHASADQALRETAQLRDNMKSLNNIVLLNTATIRALARGEQLLRLQINQLANITDYLDAKSRLMPIFLAQQQMIIRGLDLALRHNAMLEGFVDTSQLLTSVTGVYASSNLIYNSKPYMITQTSRVLVRAIDVQNMQIIAIMAVPISMNTDLYVIGQLYPFGAFNSNQSIYSEPVLPSLIAIPVNSSSLHDVTYPAKSCAQRPGIQLCESSELLSEPPGQMCHVPLGTNTESCRLLVTHIDPNVPFVKATMFGGGYVVATTCKHYRLFKIDSAQRPIRGGGTHKVPKSIAKYQLPHDQMIDFCPGQYDSQGTMTINGFGQHVLQVDSLNVSSVELGVPSRNIGKWTLNDRSVEIKNDEIPLQFSDIMVDIKQKDRNVIEMTSSLERDLHDQSLDASSATVSRFIPLSVVCAVILLMGVVLYKRYIQCCKCKPNQPSLQPQPQHSVNNNIVIRAPKTDSSVNNRFSSLSFDIQNRISIPTLLNMILAAQRGHSPRTIHGPPRALPDLPELNTGSWQ